MSLDLCLCLAEGPRQVPSQLRFWSRCIMSATDVTMEAHLLSQTVHIHTHALLQ